MESGLMVLSIYCAHMAPKWNRLLELRPRQRKDMSVEVYYYEFCNWKKKLDEVNYIGFEESYIDDFLCGLKMDLMVRVWGYKWKPRTLYGAFRRAEIEETMVSWKELSRKNDAYKVFEEMSHPNSINIVASQGAADVSDEDGNAVPDASGLVEDRFRSDLPIESTLQGDKSQVNVLEDSACNMFDEMPKLIAVEPNEEINGDKIPSIDCVLQVFDSSEVTGTVATVGLMKMGSLKFAHNLFDKMLQQFSAKEKNGIEGHEKWEPSVIDFRTDLGSKTDETKVGSANSSSKMMFGEMGVFMFDPGGSSWHRVGCDSIDSNGVKQDGVAQVFDPGIGATGNVPANVSNLEEEGAIYVSRRHAFPRQMQLNGLCISNQGETGLIKSMDTQGSGLNVSRLSKTLDNHEYSAFEGEESIDDIQNVYIAKKILDVANLCHLQEVVRFVLKQDEKGNADIVLIDKDVMFYFDPGGSGSFYHLRVWEDIFEHMSRTFFEKSMEKYVDFRIAADYNHMEIALDTLFLVTNAKRNVAYTVCIDFDFGLTSNSMDVVAVLGLISGVIQRHQMGVSYYEDASRISPLNDIQADNSRKLLLRENMAYKHMNWAGTTLPRLKYTYVIEISVAAEPTYFKLGKKKKIHGYILSQGYEIHHLIMFEFLDGSCCPKLSVGVYAGLACVKGFLAIISLSQLLRIQSRHTGLDHIQSRHIARSGYVLQIFDNERYFLTDDGVILSFDPGGSSWFRMGCHHFKPNGDKQNLEFWFGEHNVDFYCTTFPADVLSFLTKCLRSQAVQQLFDKMPSTVLPIVCWLRKAKRLNGQKLLHGQEPWSSIVITQLAPKIDCIHDSARPLMIAEDVEKVLKDGLLIGDVVFGVPAKATIKEADKDDEYSPCETWLENFVWDPGQCAISVYILEDKDVFERVGKLIIPMDITWVKIEVIKDVQTICIIMGWCKIDRYLRLSCDNANDGITFVIIAGLRASLKILGRSITKEVLEITAPLEFDVVGLFWMLLCNSPWVEETRGLFASLCYDDLGVIMNSSNTMPSILGSSLVTYKIFKIRKCNRTALAKSASQLQMVPVGFSREPEDANKFNGATMDNVVWDLGLIWVSHITTLRTRWLLRGRICHDPRLKRLLENALVSVRYEFLAVSDVICDVMSIFYYSSILSYCPSSEVVKGYIN